MNFRSPRKTGPRLLQPGARFLSDKCLLRQREAHIRPEQVAVDGELEAAAL